MPHTGVASARAAPAAYTPRTVVLGEGGLDATSRQNETLWHGSVLVGMSQCLQVRLLFLRLWFQLVIPAHRPQQVTAGRCPEDSAKGLL